MKQAHLTDEQFTDLLSGNMGEGSTPHLDACPQCRLELGRVRAAIEDFNTISLKDAEMRAAERIHPARSRLPRWRVSPSLQAATAAACLSVMVLLGLHARLTPSVRSAQVAPAAVETINATKELDADNQLLVAIDAELSRREQSPVPVAELKTSAKTNEAPATRELAD